MAYTLQQLTDLEDIKVLKHRYFRGIDTADMTLLASLFTLDIDCEYRGGTYKVALKGRSAMLEFLANAFHSGAAAMHHGHMPEITLTGDNSATGIWYLEDIFINVETGTYTSGTAIYRDHYRREGGVWKLSCTEYDRVMELNMPLPAEMQVSARYLAAAGRQPEARSDISHLISWI
jgi:hypothetical protein